MQYAETELTKPTETVFNMRLKVSISRHWKKIQEGNLAHREDTDWLI